MFGDSKTYAQVEKLLAVESTPEHKREQIKGAIAAITNHIDAEDFIRVIAELYRYEAETVSPRLSALKGYILKRADEIEALTK